MIDEKRLIETLEDYKNNDWNKKLYTSLPAVVDDCIDFVDNQPKIGEWIPCSERLPEEKINPITNDFYEYQVTFKNGDVTDIRHYKFGDNHWWSFGQNMDKYVTAWHPLPDAYIVKHGEGEANEQ